MSLNPTQFSGLNKHGTATGDLLPFTDAGTNVGMPDQRFGHVVVGPHSGLILHATPVEVGLSDPVEFGLSIDTSGGPDNGKLVINTASGNLWAIDQLGNISSPTTGSTLVDSTHTFSIKHSNTLSGIFEISDQTQDTIDSPPANLRWAVRMTPNPMNGAQESAAIITRIDPLHAGDNFYGIYGEITANQVDTSSAFMKVVSKGAGDAVYIASYGTGAALEAAAYQNGNRGIISTLQNVGLAYNQFGNNTLFQGVWGYDGTGGSIVPPNFGMFYAARSLGNSFVTRKQDPAASGAVDGRTEWKIMEFDLSRNRVEIYNDGTSRFLSKVATSSFNFDSPALNLVGSFWNGSSASDLNSKLVTAVSGGVAALRIYTGPVSSETLVSIFNSAGLDLQAHNLTGVANATIQNLTVTGTATLPPISSTDLSSATLEVSSLATIAKLTVPGLTSLTTLQNSGNVAVGGTMSVAGTVTLSGNLNVLGSTNLTTAGMITESIQANEVVGGTVLVSGQLTVLNSGAFNSLGVAGNTQTSTLTANTATITTINTSGINLTGASVINFGAITIPNGNSVGNTREANHAILIGPIDPATIALKAPGQLAFGKTAIVIGIGARVTTTANDTDDNNIAIGSQSTITTNAGTAFNNLSGGHAFRNLVIGHEFAGIQGYRSIAFGNEASTAGFQNIAIGDLTSVGGGNPFNGGGLAPTPVSEVQRSVAIGAAASANNNFSVALGQSATTVLDHQIMLGTSAEQVTVPGTLTVAGTTTMSGLLNLVTSGTFNNIGITGNLTLLGNLITVQSGDNRVTITDSTGFNAGTNSVVIGQNARSSSFSSVVIGQNSHDDAQTGGGAGRNIAIGQNAGALVGTNRGIAIGRSATVNGNRPIAIGDGAGQNNLGQPGGLAGINDNSLAIGNFANAGGKFQVALGNTAQAFYINGGESSIAIGSLSTVSGVNSTVIGASAISQHTHSVALGAGATTTANNQMMMGTSADQVVVPGSLNFTGFSQIQFTGTHVFESDGASIYIRPQTSNGSTFFFTGTPDTERLRINSTYSSVSVPFSVANTPTIPGAQFHVAGATLLAGTLANTGNAQHGGTLSVAGATTLSGVLNVGAGLTVNQSTKSTTYSLLSTDYVIYVNATGGAFNVTLPDATLAIHNGRTYVIKKKDASANNVTLVTTSAQTIDGAANLSITGQNTSYTLCNDGANWFII